MNWKFAVMLVSLSRLMTGLALLGAIFALSACDDGAPAAVPAAASAASPRLAAPRLVRYVKFEELSEWNGKPWAAVAELNLLDATGAPIDRQGWTATADSQASNDIPAHAIDGDPSSLWHTPWENGSAPPPPHWLVIDMGRQARVSGFRYLPRQDKTVNGTFARYRFYVSNDGIDWGQAVASGDFTESGVAGREKTVVFAQQTVNHPPTVPAVPAQVSRFGEVVRLSVPASDPDGDPLTYSATGLPDGISLSPRDGRLSGTPIKPGNFAVDLTVSDNKGASTKVAFGWTVKPPVIEGPPPGPGETRFVKLEALSEINGKPWTSVAEFKLIDDKGAPLPSAAWAASADSADASDAASNAIDGNTATLWHSQWDGAAPPPPHSLIVDLGRPTRVAGFKYLPRQDGLGNGTIAKYRFYLSANGVDWGAPVAEGDFSTMGATAAEKTVRLK